LTSLVALAHKVDLTIGEGLRSMSLTPAQITYLVQGPNVRRHRKAFEGPCQAVVAWRKHRADLLEASPLGRRPWYFWVHEMKLKQKPGEHAELKLILELGLARGEDEARFVDLRLAELNQLLQTRRNPFRAVA
jgi:hypothetical protein